MARPWNHPATARPTKRWRRTTRRSSSASPRKRPRLLHRGLPLEAADIELALRYLTEFRVVVIAAPLDAAALNATTEAAGFVGAHVVRLDAADATASEPPAGGELTAFAAPEHDEPAFGVMVGRYAAALDAGRSSADALREATRGTNWERAATG